ncbi:hypothetical protein B0O99DRAFT_618159 [Bisporella sp. PMI_857]|nr:hypothetical protein B0O99DRAFT_618159 [Bisporella sp. PMI_857]
MGYPRSFNASISITAPSHLPRHTLFALPLEIRYMIYIQLLHIPHTITLTQLRSSPAVLRTGHPFDALLITCTQIRYELLSWSAPSNDKHIANDDIAGFVSRQASSFLIKAVNAYSQVEAIWDFPVKPERNGLAYVLFRLCVEDCRSERKRLDWLALPGLRMGCCRIKIGDNLLRVEGMNERSLTLESISV